MKLAEEFEQKFASQIGRIVADETKKLFSDLVANSPVAKGTFKSAWTIAKDESFAWTIHNPMQYASILWDGRRSVEGIMRGSEQWPQGGEPMLVVTNRRLEERLNRLKM